MIHNRLMQRRVGCWCFFVWKLCPTGKKQTPKRRFLPVVFALRKREHLNILPIFWFFGFRKPPTPHSLSLSLSLFSLRFLIRIFRASLILFLQFAHKTSLFAVRPIAVAKRRVNITSLKCRWNCSIVWKFFSSNQPNAVKRTERIAPLGWWVSEPEPVLGDVPPCSFRRSVKT